MLWKLLFGFCAMWWILFSVFSVFCIQSFGDCTHPQHQETTYKNKLDKATELLACEQQTYFRLSLLSLPLFFGGAEATPGNTSAVRRLLSCHPRIEILHSLPCKYLNISLSFSSQSETAREIKCRRFQGTVIQYICVVPEEFRWLESNRKKNYRSILNFKHKWQCNLHNKT